MTDTDTEKKATEGETTDKKAPAKKKTASKRITNTELMKAFSALKQGISEVAASSSEANGKVDDVYFMTSDMYSKLGIITESLKLPSPSGAPPEGEEYVTSKQQFNLYSKLLNRREGELANQKLLNLLTMICTMREDFGKLCSDMGKDISKLSAQDVLDSFSAYQVDLENMLGDAGVAIGPYGEDGGKVDALHQRIVNVIPTDDPEKNGTVAERLTDGYEYSGRVLLKEKVNVYRKTQ